MNTTLISRILCTFALLTAYSAQASEWNTQDYDLYPGDFNGDGKTDVLYIAKNSSKTSGIALSDGEQWNNSVQTFVGTAFGIPLGNGAYVPVIGDFNWDGRDDIFFQSQTPGSHSLLLAQSDGTFNGVSQTIPNTYSGMTWSGDQHRIIAVKGKSTDPAHPRGHRLFLQAVSKGSNNAIISTGPSQLIGAIATGPWNDGYQGFQWNLRQSLVHSGDFNGDGEGDLLVQAKPDVLLIDYDVPIPVVRYRPQSFGILYSPIGSGPIVLWDRMQSGVDWSANNSNLVIADMNGDGRADIIVQPKKGSNSSYLVLASSSANALTTPVAFSISGVSDSTGSAYRMIAANINGGPSDGVSGIYLQSTSASDDNLVVHSIPITGGAVPSPAQSAVGRTGANFSVGPTGAANYSIPIWTPPGVRGLQPSLSINYSSQAGNGLLGVGWNLSGFSVVQRCDATYAQDGIGGAPQLDSNDKFCLDGNRLRATSGTYGADLTSYQTEIANFSNVISHGTAGSGPAWFEVRAKNGLTYEYGHSTDSAILAKDTSSVRIWALTKVSDRTGNSMTFTYANDTVNGSFRPASIQYTFTGSSLSNNFYRVLFTYQARSSADGLWGYAIGGIDNEFNLLQQVSAQYYESSSWKTVRSYTLSYESGPTSQRSRIKSIQECSASNCFVPTVIGYQDGQLGWANEQTQVGTMGLATPTSAMPIDINGDGIADLVYPDSGGTWRYVLGTSSGAYQGPYDSTLTNANYSSAISMDYNGDGRMDVLVPNAIGTWRVMYFQAAGSPFTYVDTTISSSGAGLGKAIARDINGDGLDDLIYFSSAGSGWAQSDYIYYRLNSSSGLASTPSTLATLANQLNNSPYEKFVGTAAPFGTTSNSFLSNERVLDFNGDGRADFLLLVGQCTADMASQCSSSNTIYRYRLYLSNPAGGYSSRDIVGYGQSGGAQIAPPLVADFNGDGCSDIAYTNGGWRVRFGTCYRSGASSALSPEVSTGQPWYGQLALAMDWDGDGRTDIVEANNASPKHWVVLRSTGSSLAAPVDITINYPTGMSAIFTADANGDGLDDLVYGSSGSLYTRLHQGVAPDLATSFTDAYGVTSSPTYVSIRQSNYNSSTVGTALASTEQKYAGTLNVVSRFVGSDGRGGTFSQDYWYQDARRNIQGRSFEGFGLVKARDNRSSLYTYRYFERVFPYTGLLVQSEVRQSDDSTLISKVQNTLADLNKVTLDSSTNNQRYFPYTSPSLQQQYEVGGSRNGALITEVSTAYTYDGYGNATNITTTATDKDSLSPFTGQVWTSIVVNTITNDAGNWCLGLPTDTTITNTLPDNTAKTRSFRHYIDYSKCRVTDDFAEPGSALEVKQTYGFDTFGNVNSVTVIGRNPDANATAMAARVTGIGFGTRGQFPESVTNALDQTTTTGYRYDLGLATSVTDPNNATSSVIYDDFGRKTRQVNADGTSTEFRLNNCNSMNGYCGFSSEVRTEVVITSRDSGGAEISRHYQHFDQLDRARDAQTQRPFGGWTYVNTTYDSLGRVDYQTLPYSTSYNGRTKYTYDAVGRPTLVELQNASNSTDRQTSYSYLGRSISATDARNYTTTKTTDVLGNLRKVVEPPPYGSEAQVITQYTYDQFNNLLSVTDAAGNVTSQAFNIRGMRISSTDPDRGAWTYTPNSLGEYVSQTDAKGQTTTYAYDRLSRPTSRTETEGQTIWTWGTSASQHNIGQLDNVTSPGGYKETYTYDGVGRPATTKYTVDANDYVFGYSYNDQGGIDTLTYPVTTGANPLKVKYNYTLGMLTSVQDYTNNVSGTSYWTLNAANERMQAVDETLGNGVRIISGFDPLAGHLSSRSSGTNGTYSNYQNNTYVWDKNENLTDRINANLSVTEHFVYDALNRLDYSTLNGTTNLDVTLDAIGNITYRSGVGTYTYHPTRKHAVASITNGWSFTYDGNGNMLTGRGSTLTWYSYNLPNTVTNGSSNTQFFYGANRQYWKQVAQYAGTNETTLYIGGLLERVTTPTTDQYRHMIPAGSATVIVTRRVSGTNSTYYVTQDSLGSSASITDSTGAQVVQENFAAYGSRTGNGWSGSPAATDLTNIANATRRGFTGHTMLDNLNLIHMNGRMYDPAIGRFVSADPLMPGLRDSQSANPYSYVGNRVMSFTDPTGLREGHERGDCGICWNGDVAHQIYKNDGSAAISDGAFYGMTVGVGRAGTGCILCTAHSSGVGTGSILGATTVSALTPRGNVTVGGGAGGGGGGGGAPGGSAGTEGTPAGAVKVEGATADELALFRENGGGNGGGWGNYAAARLSQLSLTRIVSNAWNYPLTAPFARYVSLPYGLGLQNDAAGNPITWDAPFTVGEAVGLASLVAPAFLEVGLLAEATEIASSAGVTVFKTGHYIARLEAGGVNVAQAEAAVANAVNVMRPNLVTGADVLYRTTINNVLIESRIQLLPNGTVNVGSIFPVK